MTTSDRITSPRSESRRRAAREITERDHPSGIRVCVINETFAKQFFEGRNPLGMHVTDVFGDQRSTFEVVGVARDSRQGSLRGNVARRFYVPATQPIITLNHAGFAIRTVAEPSSVVAAVRRAIMSWDPNLSIMVAGRLPSSIDERMVQDRLLAQLSMAFGVVALLLAAIGLYGVLSYGVAQRINEIGIGKALGAQYGTAMVMILRETGLLLVVGLVAGVGLAAMGMRLITSRPGLRRPIRWRLEWRSPCLPEWRLQRPGFQPIGHRE